MLHMPVTLFQLHAAEAARHVPWSKTDLDHVVPYHGYEIPRGPDAAITVSGTKIKAWLDGKPCHGACEFAGLVDAKREKLVNWLEETVGQTCSIVGKWTKASGRSAPSFIALAKVVRDEGRLVGSALFEQTPFRICFFEDGEISFTQVHASQDLQAVLHKTALLQYNHAENTRGRQYAIDWEGHMWAPAVAGSSSPIFISRHDRFMADLQRLPACSPSNARHSGNSGGTPAVHSQSKILTAIGHDQKPSFTHPV